MDRSSTGRCGKHLHRWGAAWAFLGGLLFASAAPALTLSVVDPAGSPVSGFRWMVEEDTSHPVVPGAAVADSLSVGIHRSYAPLALDNGGQPASGTVTGASVNIDLATNRRYAVSILPLAAIATAGQTWR